jgi:predicted  nucleic acid-binding Zn-ribbon protein
MFISKTGVSLDLPKAHQNHTFLGDSFVAGQVEIMDLNDKISEITQKITSLKFEVMSMMEDSYVTFNALHQETVQLDGRMKELSSDMDQLLTRVETQVHM